ncbi:hypothetical protein FSP39_017299 [Pinctada imbricata]|uniref:Uncharacterized protein n=1 Tax=Pinctada imbricata TaxID=66713 RepID=A0AA88XRR2_PINIB|nr:hypothetical protein FSP39_017299 [Pinctada imbricata]
MTQEETNEKAQEEAPEKPPQGEKRQRQEDLRDEVAGSLPSEGEESQPGPSTKKAKKGKKKGMSVHELVKQNQLEYNKFLTKKIPKLLRALGVSPSSDSEREGIDIIIFLFLKNVCWNKFKNLSVFFVLP